MAGAGGPVILKKKVKHIMQQIKDEKRKKENRKKLHGVNEV